MRNTDCVQVHKQIAENEVLLESLLGVVLVGVVHDEVIDLALMLDSAVERVLKPLRPLLRFLQLLLLLLVRVHIVLAHPLGVWAPDEVLGRVALRVVLVEAHHLALLLLLQVLRVDRRGGRLILQLTSKVNSISGLLSEHSRTLLFLNVIHVAKNFTEVRTCGSKGIDPLIMR